MSNQKTTGDLVAVQPITEVTVLPPNSGVVGRFLEEVHNMFKARAMRMGGLLRQIDESGQRTEVILRMAAERMGAAESALQHQFQKQGLLSETREGNEVEDANV